MSQELKMCAHCGKPAIPATYSEEYGLWNIECERCPASMWAETERLVMEAWNTRADDARVDALAGLLREVIDHNRGRLIRRRLTSSLDERIDAALGEK